MFFSQVKVQLQGGVYNHLGGGNSNIFYFHPELWGNDPI